MSRVLALACSLLLIGALAWQVSGRARSGAEPGVQRVPVFSPASLGRSTAGSSCPGARSEDPDVRALAKLPLEWLLDGLAQSAGEPGPELRDALDELARRQRGVLELRNQRHAWNVESMELTARLANALEPEQLDWVLSNRDRVARERMDQGVWRRLGVQP
jgi:hypothetical protein